MKDIMANPRTLGQSDITLSSLAAAIGDPSRARMLCCLLDGHARTSTELAIVAAVSPSTASAHLGRLKDEHLIKLHIQGKHRYYSLAGAEVAAALESLLVLAGVSRPKFASTTPEPLRYARTCYDHMAGTVAIALHLRFAQLRWITPHSVTPQQNPDGRSSEDALDLTPAGTKALESLGIDIAATRSMRRRFAYGCLDWSERKPHIGGALGAALLQMTLHRKWVAREYDNRALHITRFGQRELSSRLGIKLGIAAKPADR